MDSLQRTFIELQRGVAGVAGVAEYPQREAARRLKYLFDVTLGDVPLATVYNCIRRFDKRNAARNERIESVLAAVQEPATAGV